MKRQAPLERARPAPKSGAADIYNPGAGLVRALEVSRHLYLRSQRGLGTVQ